MARKKQEIALQQSIETQEEWEEMLTKEGLIVVDIYQEWAGPCNSVVANFRRIRNELGDDLLKFSMAKADTIDSLERYRGKCEPCFHFYAGGCLVAVVRGANAPVLNKTLMTELAKEHKVLKGEDERVEIRDPMFAHLDSDKTSAEESETDQGEDAADMIQKEVTVALLKPDIVRDGKTDEVLERMRAAGIEILKHEERQLTEEEAKSFYSHLADEPFFKELVEFMCSGPSHVLLLSKADHGKGIINEWRELIGPKEVEKAKEQAPDSLRAQYGSEELKNAFHGSDTQQTAIKELAFFFPEYQVPMVAKKGGKAPPARAHPVQRTLALIRPDALMEKKDEILSKIRNSGFTIALQKEVQLTKEQAVEFYKEHEDQPYFDELIERMTKGPLMALGLARDDAVTEWRKLLGPKTMTEAKEQAPDSLRAAFGIEGTEVNMIHGSDTNDNAEKELDYFFPLQQTIAVVKPDAYQSKDEIIEQIKKAGFHVAARKETQVTKDIAHLLYKNNAELDYYDDLVEHMTSGPSLFMVLTKEDAVEGWRGAIGPTDPTQAKEIDPNSIRAQFGTDIKANAIHGASTESEAQEVIKELFGEISLDKFGKIDIVNEEAGSTLKDDVIAERTEEIEQSKEEAGGESTERPADNTVAEEDGTTDIEAQAAEAQTKTEGEATPPAEGETAPNDVPAGDAPAGDAPAGDAPAGDAPAGDAPAGDAPAGDAPAGDAPAGDAPAGDAPAGDAPAGDAPAKTNEGLAEGEAAEPTGDKPAESIEKSATPAPAETEQKPEGEGEPVASKTPAPEGEGETDNKPEAEGTATPALAVETSEEKPAETEGEKPAEEKPAESEAKPAET